MESPKCQKCRTPLKLDGSLQNLNATAFDLLVDQDDFAFRAQDVRLGNPGEHSEERNVAVQQASPLIKRSMPIDRRGISASPAMLQDVSAKDNSAMSFIMLTDSQLQPSRRPLPTEAGLKSETEQRVGTSNQSHTHSPHASVRLFDILSAQSDIDHPICDDCTDMLLASLQSRLSASTKERDAYARFLKGLKSHRITESEVAESAQNVTNARQREDDAFSELVSLEGEKSRLEQELADLDAEARALDAEETQYWRSRNAFEQRLASSSERHDALDASLDHDVQQLARLERTNVYNDTFFISHDGPFGTINGLRLGRLSPPNNVEWPEINAAWGTTALLIATVAERLKFTFNGYVLRPMGSTSRIDKLSGIETPSLGQLASQSTQARTKSASLELFSSGDLPLGRQLLHRRFNEAMVAFIDCLRQLCDHIRTGNETSRVAGAVALPPYKIDKDRINGVSIKLGVNTDESWTTACKYTLTCCKFLLAHISNIS